MGEVRIRQWSLLNSLGGTRADFRQALADNRCGLKSPDRLPDEFGRFRTTACIGAIAAELTSPAELPPKSDTRQLRLALAGLAELEPELVGALERWGGRRVGLVLGTSTGGILQSEAAYASLVRTGTLSESYSCRDGHAFDGAPRYVARVFGIEGPVYVVSTACSSSGKAIAAAKRLIDCGVCDAVLTGGVDTLCRLTLMGFASLGVLSDEPCAPFSDATTGMNVAEGASWLLLDKSSGPIALLGTGESSDAHHMVAPHPDGSGALVAMQRALSAGAISPQHVDYVNAHGTGTKANDASEQVAIGRVFPQDLPYTSTKGLHGHQLGAAGATEAIVCSELMLRPTGTRYPGSGRTRTWRAPNLCLSNSLAFGGSNVSLLLGRASTESTTPESPLRPSEVFVRSVGFWSPGAPNVRTLLAEQSPPASCYEPEATLLPPRQRGRAALLTRMFAEVLAHLLPVARNSDVPVVYGSAFGPVQTTLSLLEQQQRGECSPLRFQHSVHNVAVGTASIALSNSEHNTAIAAGANTLAAALLEGICWLQANESTDVVAVVVGDEAPPKPLLNEDYPPMTAGLLLSRSRRGALARLSLLDSAPSTATPLVPVPRHSSLVRNPTGSAASLLWCLGNARWGTYQLSSAHAGWQPGVEILGVG